MPTNCYTPADAPTCSLSCEDIECALDAASANITNLFRRTDDLNQGIVDEATARAEGDADLQSQIDAIEAGASGVEEETGSDDSPYLKITFAGPTVRWVRAYTALP